MCRFLVTVTNTLDCNKPPLAVAKKVVNNTGGPLPPGLPFAVNVTCGTTTTQQLTLVDGPARADGAQRSAHRQLHD